MSEYENENGKASDSQNIGVNSGNNVNPAPVNVRVTGNSEVCSYVRTVMSSNMGFAAAIASACPLFFMLLSLITGVEAQSGIILMIPLIFPPVEAWVTFGTARWGKGKIMRGGIILGKVISIFKIILSIMSMIALLINAIIFAISASLLGNYYDGLAKGFFQILGLDVDVNFARLLASYSSGMVFLACVVLMIPFILNIVLNVQLNNFRNGIIDAIDGLLNKFQKTILLAVMIFLVGLSVLAFTVLFLRGALISGKAGYIFAAFAYVIVALMYFYSGVMIAVFGRGK